MTNVSSDTPQGNSRSVLAVTPHGKSMSLCDDAPHGRRIIKHFITELVI